MSLQHWQNMGGGVELRRKTLSFFAITAMLALAVIALFFVQTNANAREEGSVGGTTTEQTPAIEEILRLGLKPSLRMTFVLSYLLALHISQMDAKS